MNRYVIEFSKHGYIKYTSHLDLQRLFKRVFKRTGVPIDYSKGYNPHPKMGFAQPLSLGYTSDHEYVEFTTESPIRLDFIQREMKDAMPEGIDIIDIKPLEIQAKSLAAIVTAAIYDVILPMNYNSRHEDVEEIVKEYLSRDIILAKKRDKKTKKYIDKDIKGQIRNIQVVSSGEDDNAEEKIVLRITVDAGSDSNLSPEQVISSFTDFSTLYLPREEIEVVRKEIIFNEDIDS